MAGTSSMPSPLKGKSNPSVLKNTASRKHDVAWQHGSNVDDKPNKIKCNYCHEVYSCGIFRFKHHLAGTHNDIEPCRAVPSEVRQQMLEIVNELERIHIEKRNSSNYANGEKRKKRMKKSQQAPKEKVVTLGDQVTQAKQPSTFPLDISEEEMREYFSEADFPSMISLTPHEDIYMVDAALQREIPTKTEDVAALRTLLFGLASSNALPPSHRKIYNKIALRLGDISRDYLGLKDQYEHSSYGLNEIKALQSSKAVLRKVYLELDEERREDVKRKKEIEEKIGFFKEEIEKLTSKISEIDKKLKSNRNLMVNLFIDSTYIDSQLNPLLAQKAGLEMDFRNSQSGLNLKRQIWEHFRVSLEKARARHPLTSAASYPFQVDEQEAALIDKDQGIAETEQAAHTAANLPPSP